MPLTAGKYWFFNTNTAGSHLEAARRFVAFMTSADSQQKWLERLGRLPSSRAAAQSEFVQKDPMLSAEILQLGRGRGLPPAPAMLCVLQGDASRSGKRDVGYSCHPPTELSRCSRMQTAACLPPHSRPACDHPPGAGANTVCQTRRRSDRIALSCTSIARTSRI